jgi:trans-aconitate methyltransferase
MVLVDKFSNIQEYYQAAIKQGDTPWAQNDYGSERSQQRRFATVVESLGIRSGDVVVDVGCGTGEFGRYLWSQGLNVKYIGYDVVPEMVEIARERVPSSEVWCLDAFTFSITHGDFVVCLGVLGVVQGNAEQRWDKFRDLWANMMSHATQGAAATAQVEAHGLKKDGLRWYMGMDEVSDGVVYLRDKYPTVGWQLRMDYHPHDVMFVGRRDIY